MPVGTLLTVSHGNCARITPFGSQITKTCHLAAPEAGMERATPMQRLRFGLLCGRHKT